MKPEPAIIAAGVIMIFVLYILCRLFIKPIKWILGLALNCAMGCGMMLLINHFGAPLGISLSLNPLTAMISGVLGLPGMAMAYVLQSLL